MLPRERFGTGLREVTTSYGGGLTLYAGHGSVATPGAFAALGVAHDRHGSARWTDVLAPSVTAPASATPGDPHTERGPASTLAGLPLPDRTVGLPGRALAATGPIREPRPARQVVVRPGDTLWQIAARHLGDPQRWPEIYALNDAAIGADPDLIHPATRLRLPADRPEETP